METVLQLKGNGMFSYRLTQVALLAVVIVTISVVGDLLWRFEGECQKRSSSRPFAERRSR